MRRRNLIIAVSLLIVVIFAGLVMTRMRTRAKEAAAIAAIRPEPATVLGTMPVIKTMQDVASFPGTIVAKVQVQVTPRVSGRLIRLLVNQGARVRKGQLLAEIERPELFAQLAQSRAGTDSAKATLASSEAAIASARAVLGQNQISLDDARTEEARMKPLIAEGAISQQQWDTTVSRSRVAAQQILVARAQLAQAQAQQAQAYAQQAQTRAAIEVVQAQMSSYLITAPMDGEITQRQVDEGAMASAGTPVFTLASTGSLQAEYQLPELQLSRLRIGQPVLVTAVAQAGQPVIGKVFEISPAVDVKTRLIRVKVDIPATGVLRPGLSVRGDFVLAERAQALTVPLAAVVVTGSDQQVFVEVAGTAKSRPVRTGLRNLQDVEILSGIGPTDKVVVAGQAFIKDGDPVIVTLPGQGSDALALPTAVPPVSTGTVPANASAVAASGQKGVAQ